MYVGLNKGWVLFRHSTITRKNVHCFDSDSPLYLFINLPPVLSRWVKGDGFIFLLSPPCYNKSSPSLPDLPCRVMSREVKLLCYNRFLSRISPRDVSHHFRWPILPRTPAPRLPKSGTRTCRRPSSNFHRTSFCGWPFICLKLPKSRHQTHLLSTDVTLRTSFRPTLNPIYRQLLRCETFLSDTGVRDKEVYE